jgi:hypothetical protein
MAASRLVRVRKNLYSGYDSTAVCGIPNGRADALGPQMHIKIYNGTVSGAEKTLCNTCRHATITRGQKLDEELVQCHAGSARSILITFKVTSCSSFNDVRQPSYMEMLEDAWILQPASRKKPAGFIRATDLRDQELRAIITELRTREDE